VPSGVKAESYDVEPSLEQIERLNRLIESGPFEVHVARTVSRWIKPPMPTAKLDKHYLGKLALCPQ